MYFGLCNSPGVFQWMMNSIFRELLYEEVLENYIDNFVIPAKTQKRAREQNHMILEDGKETQSLF